MSELENYFEQFVGDDLQDTELGCFRGLERDYVVRFANSVMEGMQAKHPHKKFRVEHREFPERAFFDGQHEAWIVLAGADVPT